MSFFRKGGKSNKAVDDLNLDACHGNITCLLGHNGSGKTTTMSMLTGMFPPSNGTMHVHGLNVQTDIEKIRKSLGVCPQFNVLWDNLSVLEHLMFTARVKGMTWADAKKQARTYLREVSLHKEENTLSKHLSGGMKRKLSLLMAFIGDSSLVILDEPSAGLDPQARRETWDLLLKFRRNRCIILSTHYLDEADLLGDRIAILSRGRLRAFGSAMFLKSYHQLGYRCTLTTSEVVTGDETKTLLQTVQSFIPNASLLEVKGCDITFVLPKEDMPSYANLFAHLEANKDEMLIRAYGVSAPLLEDAFVKTMNDADADDEMDDEITEALNVQESRDDVPLVSIQNGGNQDNSDEDEPMILDGFEGSQLVNSSETSDSAYEDPPEVPIFTTGIVLALRRFRALITKRFHYSRRDTKAISSQIILPAVFICLGMLVANAIPHKGQMPPLEMNITMFDSICGKESANTVPFYDGVDSELSRGVMNSLNTRVNGLNLSMQEEFYHPSGSCGPPCESINTTAAYLLNTHDEYADDRFGAVTMEHSILLSTSKFAGDAGEKDSGVVMRTWYDGSYIHSLPAFLNLGNNALLQSVTKSKRTITTYNHPLNITQKQDARASLDKGTDLTVAINVIIAMAFIPASFVVFLVAERADKSKHLQFVSGVTPTVYWLSNYAWDVINYMVPFAVAVAVFQMFGLPAYTGRNLPATAALLMMYGLSMTPAMYPASFIFSNPSTAYITLICLNLFVGLTGTLATFTLDLFKSDPVMRATNNVLKWILLLFPNYCLGRSLISLANNEYHAEYREVVYQHPEGAFRDPFRWNTLGKNLTFMAVDAVLYLVLTIMIEKVRQWQLRKKAKKTKERSMYDEEDELEDKDDDVMAEQNRVNSLSTDHDHPLVVKELLKIYKSRRKKKTAVNNLSFLVEKGECFGLLGVNGAGKTSTFKMLTGDTRVTKGEAWVNGHSVLQSIGKVRRSLGYTPQFDALCPLLTARETLYFYSRLRGIPENKIKAVADWAIKNLDLTRWADRPSKTYSGGNKRKLSVAVALLPGVNFLMMDEPTAGVDVRSRRFLWKVLHSVLREGKSLLLTSHSMDESEALCSRLAIMVNGEFRCMGSPQYLKTKFGDGYTLILKAKEGSSTEPLKEFISEKFPNSRLEEEHNEYVEFSLRSSDTELNLSDMFRILQDMKETYDIEDYLVSQTTLHSVFCQFVAEQDSDRIDDHDDDDDLEKLNDDELSALESGVAPMSNRVSGQLVFTQDGEDDDLLQDDDELPLLSVA